VQEQIKKKRQPLHVVALEILLGQLLQAVLNCLEVVMQKYHLPSRKLALISSFLHVRFILSVSVLTPSSAMQYHQQFMNNYRSFK
jgi:hypothetical protein